MFSRGQVLKTEADFENAMLFAAPVTVWQRGELIDYGGSIKAHNRDAVYIGDGFFLKQVCEFRVR